MSTRARISLAPPDLDYWQQNFPDGLGTSAFAAPAFQKALLRYEKEEWSLKFLRYEGERGPLTIPVFAQRASLRRHKLVVRPVGYYVMPIERSILDGKELRSIFNALCTLRIAWFIWWLAPWAVAPDFETSHHRNGGRLDIKSVDTYIVKLENTAEEHLRHVASKTHRSYRKVNQRRGLVLTSDPTAEQCRSYAELYRREYEERGWSGPHYDEFFFETIRTRMGRGGELAVCLYEGEVVGGGVLLYDRHSVHYFQGTMDRRVRAVRPHTELLCYALECAEKRGLSYLNMGGINAGNEGLIAFKESWGARATPVPIITWKSGPRLVLNSMLKRLP